MKRTIEDIDLQSKKVLLRVDFNVPLDEFGNVQDPTRIFAALPTIKYLLSKQARIIICSHLGRPKGEFVDSLSLSNVAKFLVNYLHCKIRFCAEAVGEKAEALCNQMSDGEIVVLENIRFYPEEEENNPIFAAKLASLADVYVNDAFGTSHRKHASTYGVAKLLPNAAGFLMGKEINAITSVLNNPLKPLVAILGGAKVSDKLLIVKNLINSCDVLLIGGGMAYTFLKAKGVAIGNSLFEEDRLEDAKEILQLAEDKGVKIYLPQDHICSNVFSPNAVAYSCENKNIPASLIGLDIGKKTVKIYKKIIKSARTIIWNGPMGVFEFEAFRNGTREIAKAVAKSSAMSVVGGGDSIAAINMLKLQKKIYHISTGGGASMKLIAGEKLPGVDVLADI